MTRRSTTVRRETPPARWHQESLFSPDVYHVTLEVGLVLSGDHVQIQVTSKDPATGELRGLWSMPHRPTSKLVPSLQEAFTEMIGFLPTF